MSCQAGERASRFRLPFGRQLLIVWKPSPAWVWLTPGGKRHLRRTVSQYRRRRLLLAGLRRRVQADRYTGKETP